jgi:plastocyanin
MAAAAMADDTASVSGKVTFVGEPPEKRTVINFGADAACADMHKDQKVGTENFIREKETNGLMNVIVYVKEGLGDKKFTAPTDKVSIDQKGCMYTPHVLTLQVGQTLTIKNSDNTTHNIHSHSEKNTPFNFAQPTAGLTRDETFKFAEIFPVKCDVHPWMNSHIGVFDHPFHAVTAKDGSFKITGLPAGKYTIVAWHELLGEAATAEVTVTGGETKEANIEIKGK